MSERRSKYAGLREAVNAEALTEIRTDGNTEAQKEVSPAASEEGRAQASEEASTATLEAARADLSEAVREAVLQRKQYAGGVKLTLDITPELNKRAKQYLLDKTSSGTVRALLTELLDGFLSREGYERDQTG